MRERVLSPMPHYSIILIFTVGIARNSFKMLKTDLLVLRSPINSYLNLRLIIHIFDYRHRFNTCYFLLIWCCSLYANIPITICGIITIVLIFLVYKRISLGDQFGLIAFLNYIYFDLSRYKTIITLFVRLILRCKFLSFYKNNGSHYSQY